VKVKRHRSDKTIEFFGSFKGNSSDIVGYLDRYIGHKFFGDWVICDLVFYDLVFYDFVFCASDNSDSKRKVLLS